ncbi:MAG: deoxyhypusine synthase family protein [Myxococcales bacterium]|nr:deoxyhypusine synthase family protein [Myxococcales bacterium]
MGSVRRFMEEHYLHFNAGETLRAARAYQAHIDAGGKMMVTLAGAMSTGRLGKILARMIRADLVHAVTCTGANLEEDIMLLCAAEEYEQLPDWRALRAEDEVDLYNRGMNRVTDVAIPETVMRAVEERLLAQWKAAAAEGISKMPHEFLWSVLADPTLEQEYQAPPEHSWVLAAKERNVPIWTPGWEDSTTGNMFAAHVYRGQLPDHRCVRSGTEQMEILMRWYQANHGDGKHPSVGFFQIGGGIAGDFPICAVPCLIQDLQIDVPKWGYFCQIGDAPASYGGYSGAPPNEKITWGKLDAATPKFMVHSDATIVAPLIFAYLLGD